MSFQGACHCGRIRVRFETRKSAEAIPVRACQCSFCRRHGARTAGDSDGRIEFRFASGDVARYRFGRRVTDFLVCGTCGVYVGALAEVDGRLYGIVNTAGAGMTEFAARAAEPMDYGDESADARAERRKRVWSPASVIAA